ncbi:MAG: molybdopterin-dependent oxidoreductase [Acidobacteria bacterium]|nr:molybdopterin-dependent oxidoreductase [Acidobacteriota bacterium]
MSEREASRRMFIKTLIGGVVGAVGAWGAVLTWRGLFGIQLLSDGARTRLLRGTLEFNEWVSENLYSVKRLAPEFPPERITPERVNGMVGLDAPDFDPSTWTLTVSGLQSGEATLILDDIKRLPRTEMITEFKCIEGWSLIQKWAGVRVSDLAAKFGDASKLPKYVSLSTPDNGYYVGWDVESIMHPQTLLAYELNGEPLSSAHGAPLRLASPLKYGIKQLKRIGRIEFTDERPRDYWAEQGYDWYSGH